MKSVNIPIGSFVLSTSGHDKNRVHIVINSTDDYVFIVDGRERKIEKPKKKKVKHIFLLDIPLYEGNFTNKDIKKKINNMTM